MEDRDADELVLVLQGYYRLISGRQLLLEQEKDVWMADQGKPYSYSYTTHNTHTFSCIFWCYLLGDGHSSVLQYVIHTKSVQVQLPALQYQVVTMATPRGLEIVLSCRSIPWVVWLLINDPINLLNTSFFVNPYCTLPISQSTDINNNQLFSQYK